MALSGHCHCGAIDIAIPHAPDWVLQCCCSICRKLGVLWAYFPDDAVRVSGDTDTYVCNNRVIAFHRCRRCGCTTHWATLGKDFGRMAINARLLDPDLLAGLALRSVPGPTADVFRDDWTG